VGRLEDAHKLLREKHELLPDDYQIRERLGDVQLAMYDKAIAALDRALKENPEDEAKKAKKQELQERRDKFALREFRWRHAQHPTDRAVQLQLGRVCLQAGEYNEAIAAFQAVSQDPRYAEEGRKLLGVCFTQKGQYDLALEQFDKAIKSHPNMDDEGKELRYLRAQTLQKMGRTEEALKGFKQIYSVDINYRDVDRRVDELSE
jgi:tetratricopeptide (TPR) repeat protein